MMRSVEMEVSIEKGEDPLPMNHPSSNQLPMKANSLYELDEL